MMCSLPELLEEDDFHPEFEEEVLVKDFTTSVETSASGGVEGGHDLVAKAQVSANMDSVDAQAAPVSLKKKAAKLKHIRSKFSGRTIKKDKLERLRVKGTDKLAFVHQMVYNTGSVKLIRKASKGGAVSASYQKMLNLFVKGDSKEETSFMVPEESTFAYGLMEILLKDEKMEISYEPWTHKENPLDVFSHDSSTSEPLHKAKEEILNKEVLLQPLADLTESTRSDLLKVLRKVLEDRHTLALLEETLEHFSKGSYDHPESPDVASFMDLLDVSGISSSMQDAIYLLVSAMDTLPDGMPPLLMSCSPETLRVLNQLVGAFTVCHG